MKADYILKADILDIIFENRNKDYGAYALRKHYNERVYKALGVIFIIALVLGFIAFLNKNKMLAVPGIPDIIFGPVVNIATDDPKTPEPPKLPQRKAVSAAVKPSVADHVPVIAAISSTNVEPPVDANPAGTEGPGTNDPTPGTTGGAGETTLIVPPATPEPPKVDPATPMRSPDVMPSYPGGIEQLKKFLEKNLVAPKELETDETISVTIQFVVGYDGILKSFQIIEDGGDAFNNEVIRVIKKMPDWIPGKSQGKNVSVYYSIPVKFTPKE